MTEGRTLLLFGASGFVGGHVRAAAEQAGLEVIGASRGATGRDLACDLLDPGSVRDAVRHAAPELVINLAGAASVGNSWATPLETFAVNAMGGLNLLDAVANEAPSAHLTFASSGEVYASTAGPHDEEDEVGPLNPYGASKAALEILCGQYARSRKLRIAVIRAFNQVGPGQARSFAASDFAGQVAEAEIEGRPEAELQVGDLSVVRDFTDVRDAAQAYVSVAADGHTGTFNLCSGRGVRLDSLIEAIAAAATVELRVRTDPARSRPAEAREIVGSHARLRAATGWEPQTGLDATMSDLLTWWRTELTGTEAEALR